MHKPDLYELIETRKSTDGPKKVGRILAEHENSVLWLPAFHPNLIWISMGILKIGLLIVLCILNITFLLCSGCLSIFNICSSANKCGQ